jgi:hypothetical protein
MGNLNGTSVFNSGNVSGGGGGDSNDKGYFVNPAALEAAYPVGEAGWFAVVGSTDTVWIWDTDTEAWADSGTRGSVSSVFGRTGAVTAQSGDYSANQILSTAFESISATEVQSALEQIYAAIPSLSGFVPYTGATGNVNLGPYSLTAGSVYLKAANPEDASVTLHALLSDNTQIAAIDFEEDGSANFSGIALSPNFVNGAQRNESVNSQTYLSADSAFYQEFFGTDFQIAKTPDATTLQPGHAFLFANNSTGNLDVRTVNNEMQTILPTGAKQIYQLSDNSTSSGVWNILTLLPGDVIWGSDVANIPTGAINLTNATSNLVNFGTNGIGAPTLETRSLGTKEVYYDSLSPSSVDYARGMAGGELWDSVPVGSKHKIYAGTEAIAEFSDIGSFIYSTLYVSDSFSTGRLGISQLAATDENRILQTLDPATYPNLTEISYVKGVTSSIQDQIDAIAPARLAWNTVSATTQTIAVNSGYVARSATSVDFTLPTSAQLGDVFEILYRSPNPGQLLQNAGQTIVAGDQVTTTGTSGRIEGINNGEVLVIRCTADNTEFMVTSPVGNFNVV